jgi:signal peptidase I
MRGLDPATVRPAGRLLLLTGLVSVAAGCGHDQPTLRQPSGAMLPTIKVGERVRVDMGAYRSTTPKRGDIVVFHPPTGALSGAGCGVRHPAGQVCPGPLGGPATSVLFIKRVVALPGDRVSMIANRTYIDGRRQSEPYLLATPCTDICNLPRQVAVAPGRFFVVGDNRGQSSDSRDWGPIERSWLVGRVLK